jgi:3-oxoacyl-[acyl-carrier-protein] synthase III
MANDPLSRALQHAGEPHAFVSQHCGTESAVLHYEPNETDIAARNRYFLGELMRGLELDHLPYFCSFASGCAGFMSLLVVAGGLLTSSSERGSTVCMMADCAPPGVPHNMLRERILGSDHSSAFVVGGKKAGYQLLGINYYSSTRTKIPFVEIVRRTVQMIEELARSLELQLTTVDVAIHYPNIFPDTWRMVTRYLQIPSVEHIIDGMAERAHCGATDSVITLAKYHRGTEGRVHIVVNYGLGLHLAVCVLQEKANGRSIEEVKAD